MSPLLTMLGLLAAFIALPALLLRTVVCVTERENRELAGQRPPMLLTFYRLLAVAGIYLLSSFGLLPSLLYAYLTIQVFNPFALACLYAWLAHLVLSLGWVFNRRLGWYWVVSGLIAGLVAVFHLPLLEYMNSRSSPLGRSADGKGLMLGMIIFLSPAWLFAIHLVRFHWRKSPPSRQEINALDMVRPDS